MAVGLSPSCAGKANERRFGRGSWRLRASSSIKPDWRVSSAIKMIVAGLDNRRAWKARPLLHRLCPPAGFLDGGKNRAAARDIQLEYRIPSDRSASKSLQSPCTADRARLPSIAEPLKDDGQCRAMKGAVARAPRKPFPNAPILPYRVVDPNERGNDSAEGWTG